MYVMTNCCSVSSHISKEKPIREPVSLPFFMFLNCSYFLMEKNMADWNNAQVNWQPLKFVTDWQNSQHRGVNIPHRSNFLCLYHRANKSKQVWKKWRQRLLAGQSFRADSHKVGSVCFFFLFFFWLIASCHTPPFGGGGRACRSVPANIRGEHLERRSCYLPRCSGTND